MLDLSKTDISDVGIEHLANVLQQNTVKISFDYID